MTNNSGIKTVYLSGPMTGYKDFNYPAFNELEAKIKELDPSIVVINPTQTGVQEGWEWNDYLAHDLKLLLDGKPDAVITLPNWKDSKGARLEVHVAEQLGKKTVTSDKFLAMLRGSIFKRPTLIYRTNSHSIFALREYEDAVETVKYHEFCEVDETGNEVPPNSILGILEIPQEMWNHFEELKPDRDWNGVFMNLGVWLKTELKKQGLKPKSIEHPSEEV